MRLGYRLRQFRMRLKADDAAVARETARRTLSKAAYKLFEEMAPGDQVHALCVFRVLSDTKMVSTDVLQAALLHDVGKARAHLTLPHRALIVLLEWLGGELLQQLALADPRSWRYPFYVHLHHPELGALRCRETGCSPLTVALVRDHELPLEDVVDVPGLGESLIALKKADESC